MAATRALTIPDVYDRFVKGKKVSVEEWDYKITPGNLTALKEKYNIKFEPDQIVPEDKDLCNRLFQAGLEMLVTTGYYNQDLGRVMHVTEEEVWEGIRKTPTKLEFGENKDKARFYPRHGNSNVKPVIQGGPTGSPISEDVFVQVMQSYAQEGIVDTIVNGLPAWVSSGLNGIAALLPCLGFALLMSIIMDGSMWPYFILGFVPAAFVGFDINMVGMAAVAVAIALIIAIMIVPIVEIQKAIQNAMKKK